MSEREPRINHELERSNYCSGIEILTGKANPELAIRVSEILYQDYDNPVSKFPDGERRAIIKHDLRRKGVFIIHPTGPPKPNARLMELHAMLDAARRESPDEITAIIPYFGYARQDRREREGAPIMSAVVANHIVGSGADRIVTIDLHSEQTMGAINKPWDNLYASYVLVPALLKYGVDPDNLVVATPDKGGFQRAIKYAEMFGADKIAIAYKQRDIDLSGKSKALFMLGDVEGKDVVIVDDILASGGTLIDAAKLMKERGAKRVMAAVTHGLFLKDATTGERAIKKIEDSPIEKVFVTDTLKIKRKIQEHEKVEVVSVAELLADAVYHIHTSQHLNGDFS